MHYSADLMVNKEGKTYKRGSLGRPEGELSLVLLSHFL